MVWEFEGKEQGDWKWEDQLALAWLLAMDERGVRRDVIGLYTPLTAALGDNY